MPNASNLSWSWNKIPNYLRHSPRVAEGAEAAAAMAVEAAKKMVESQTTAAAHAKAAAAVAAVVAAAAAAETPPSERKNSAQIATNGYYISLQSVSLWKQTKTNILRDGRQSL